MATAKKAAAQPTASQGNTKIPNPADMLKGMAERLQSVNLTGAGSKLLDSGRKDLQAVMQANEKSYKGLQTVVQRQTEMIKSAIAEWQSAAKAAPGKDPKENLAKLAEGRFRSRAPAGAGQRRRSDQAAAAQVRGLPARSTRPA